MYNPLFLSLDIDEVAAAERLLQTVGPYIGGIKIGMRFLLRHGPTACSAIAQFGSTHHRSLFLDLKFHDIPSTVQAAVRATEALQPEFLTVHCAGGETMMRAAVTAANQCVARPRLLGVTQLTSLQYDIDTVMEQAREAFEAGLDGVVCSPWEVSLLRQEFGPNFILMVPGIRETLETHDQKRVASALTAMEAGATFIVVGRAITQAADPIQAAEKILNALRAHHYA
jgi:orotidine-5'-phosphate decarboxylase